MGNRAPPELRELAAQVGKFIQYWGFKKVHGQIWSYIFLAKEPVDASTLVKRLNVSKALVSLAIKDLLKFKVIQVVGQGRRRRILLQSNPDLMQVICSILEQRERALLNDIQSSFEKVKKLDCSIQQIDIDVERLEELGEMITLASETLDTMISCNLNFIPNK